MILSTIKRPCLPKKQQGSIFIWQKDRLQVRRDSKLYGTRQPPSLLVSCKNKLDFLFGAD